MSGPTQVNSAATEADKIIKDLEEVLNPALQSALVSAFPTLGLPVIKQIVDVVEEVFANYLTKGLELEATDLITNIQVGSEQSRISKDVVAIAKDEANHNATQLATDEATYAKDTSVLINDDGSSQPL